MLVFLFGCQADKVSPKASNNGTPSLQTDENNPHPLPTNICSAIDTLALMDQSGSENVSYCGPATCPPGMPKWGFVEVLNGMDNMYLNLTLTPGWFVKRCDNYTGTASNLSLDQNGIPVMNTDWTPWNIDPVVNKWQMVLPLNTMPNSFSMATAMTVVKLNFFNGVDPNSETRLWVKNADWNNTAAAPANTMAPMVHNVKPESCFEELEYCKIKFSCSGYEHIANVKIGDIDNASGNDGGYADYTDVSTHLQAGTQATITLTPGFSGQPYTERWVVFIDWNRDGDFFDSDELVTYGASSQAITRTIDVPANAAQGDLRMRVAMRWGCWPACPCGSYYYGEAEDYTIWVDGNNNSRLAPREDDNVNMVAFGNETEAPGDVELTAGTTNQFRSGSVQTVGVSVLDANNQEVYKTMLEAKVGVNDMNFSFPGMGKGEYKYVITGSEDRAKELVVKGIE